MPTTISVTVRSSVQGSVPDSIVSGCVAVERETSKVNSTSATHEMVTAVRLVNLREDSSEIVENSTTVSQGTPKTELL